MNAAAIRFEISCFFYIFYAIVDNNFFSFYLDNDKYFRYTKVSKIIPIDYKTIDDALLIQ